MIVLYDKNYPYCSYSLISVGLGLYTKVDPCLFVELSIFNWWLKKSFHCWYVVRWSRKRGKRILLRMHRIVAHTPGALICHHINGNTLDNRLENLDNITEFMHQKLYSWR